VPPGFPFVFDCGFIFGLRFFFAFDLDEAFASDGVGSAFGFALTFTPFGSSGLGAVLSSAICRLPCFLGLLNYKDGIAVGMFAAPANLLCA
jgi:hypothetical protein